MDDLVSVIIPIYNVEKYLGRCVNSVIKQSYKNLEIILVDDGSPDKCGEMCDKYANLDARVKVIHKSNGGLSSARNAGLDICTGEYILFVDSDDWISEDAIESSLTLINNSGADIVAFSFYIADAEKTEGDYNVTHVNVYDFEKVKAVSLLENFREQWDKVLIVAWNKLYRRKVFEKVRFVEGVYHEDEYTIIKILENADDIYSVDIPLYYYYLSENSIMRNNNKKINYKKTIDLIQMYRYRVKRFLELGYSEQAKETFLDYVGTLRAFYSQMKDNEENELAKEMLELKKIVSNSDLNSKLTHFFRIKVRLFCWFPNIVAKIR